jgi:hypothetical protein
MAAVPERPQAITQLNSLLGAATIAHEAIFELRRKLIAARRASPEHLLLLVKESARIVTVELSGLSANARQLSTQWSEQSLLDPEGAARTLAELEPELGRIKLPFLALHERQREIATQLRSMLES